MIHGWLRDRWCEGGGAETGIFWAEAPPKTTPGHASVRIGRSVGTATDLANNAGIEDRGDVLSVEQLVTLAVTGLRALGVRARRDALSQIVERYNDIVGEVETDPSLRIALA